MSITEAPKVIVPDSPALAQEPARTIGREFADAAYVRTLLLAVFAVTGALAPQLIPSLDDGLATSLSTIIVAVVGLVLARQAKVTPRQQGEATREAVYSPASVAEIVNERT